MDTKSNPANSGRQLISKRDGIFILSLLLIAILFGAFRMLRTPEADRVCHIIYNHELVMTVPLDKNQVFSIEELPHVAFQVRNQRIAFISSSCPDQICVNTGFIGKHGQFAACLPNKISLRIEGDPDDNAPDAIT